MNSTWLVSLIEWGSCRGRAENEDRRSRLLSRLLFAVLGSMILLASVNALRYLTNFQRQDGIFFWIDGLSILCLVGMILLNRRGNYLWAARSFLILSWLSISFLFPVEMNDHTKVMLAAPIVISSFILRPRSSFTMAGLSALSYTTRYFFDPSGYRYSVLGVLSFFMLALMSYLIANELEKTLAHNHLMMGELRKNEEQFRLHYENSPLPYQSLDAQGIFLTINSAWTRIFGYQREEVVGRWFGEFLEPDELEPFRKRFSLFIQHGEIHDVELKMQCKDLRWITVSIESRVGYYPDGSFRQTHCILQDITERRQAEERLKNALADKEILLREVYHRTKNNLQVVSSLLDIQASSLQDEQAAHALHELNEKIHSMALVHQKLYQSQSLKSIDLKEYIADLMELIQQGYLGLAERIQVIQDTESVLIPIGEAVSCGLILTELVINSLKHAFPGDRAGEIRITLRNLPDSRVMLRIADNGVGVPPDFDFQRQKSLGLRTVCALGERQLHAQVTFSNGDGVTCEILCRFE